jgi:O-antigen/teichoic acid export membrane protein
VPSPTSFRRLGRNTVVYSISGILARAVGVFMLPVYTRYLDPAQYGLLQLLDITVEITAILFTAGIRSGLLNFYSKAATEDERNRVLFTTFFLEMLLSVAGTVALVASAGFVQRLVLNGAGSSDLVRLAALNFSLSAMTAVPTGLLVIEQRAGLITVSTLAKLAIQVGLNIYFLAYRHLGVESILLSTTIASAVVGSVLVTWLLARTGIRLSLAAARNLRRFGVPYQIATAGAFILVFGDRFFLAHYKGDSEVGLYALAYQFGFLLYTVSTGPFLAAWAPQRYELISHSREDRDASYSRGFLYFNLVLITAATGVVVFVRPALAVLTNARFHGAAALVPIIVAAYVVQSWGDAVRFGIDVSERTKLYTWASWIATVVVLVCYAVLIPRFGGFGAAFATLIAFAVRAALGLYWSQKAWPVTYKWGRSILLTVISVAVCAPAMLSRVSGATSQFAVSTALMVIYGALTWYFVLDNAHRSGIRDVLRSRKLAAIFGQS